jgi:2-polyprenyl-6-methoxyphenol hydroxylase-like FAD-dependent oxidoreductase
MRTIVRSDERILSSDVFDREAGAGNAGGSRPSLGVHEEPARQIPVYRECDVLVIGGGPSGTAASVAAARGGAEVILLERYNHLGGLSTGGLVIWIDRMSDWKGELVIQGFAKELFDRLPPDAIAGPDVSDWGSRDVSKAAHWAQRTAAYHGVVTWSPTIDPERLKLLSQQMVIEAGVRLVYHSWASLPIMEGGKVCGATFESKEGRMAIRARVVIDATGDGDIFSRAGAASENDIEENDVHHCMNTAWLFGGVDMNRWIAFKAGQPEAFGEFLAKGRAQCGLFDRPFVSWRNEIALFMGPRQSGYSGLDVDDLSTVEVRSHQAMERMLDFYREHGPGFESAFLMLSAPQVGVRHSRRLKGVEAVLRSRWSEGLALPTEIGVSPAVSPKFPNISIPYGALVPEQLDGLLACGRHVSCDRNSHGFMREIPQCWITGQAAGAAAALAVSSRREVRDIDVGALQTRLLDQGVYLRRNALHADELQAKELPTKELHSNASSQG